MKQIQTQIELTQEGLDELQAELRELADVKLPEVIARVAKAREYGDLSENAEYHSARDEQELLQARIDEVQQIVNNAVVVKQTKSHTHVGVGSQVVVNKKGSAKDITFEVVGEFEADPKVNKISSVSPVGKALVGKKKGDKVTVNAPAGEIEYTIKEIK